MKNNLSILREEIDRVDQELLTILARRMKIVKKIGEYKKANNILALDENRFKNIVKKQVKKGKELNLAPSFIENIYKLIHEYALVLEEKL